MKKVKENFKNKKGIVIIVASTIALIVLGLGIFFGLKQFFFKEKPKENKLTLVDKLDVEINSEVNLLSFIKDSNNLEILSEDEKVDTTTLGSKELVIKYLDNEEEKEYKFKINVIDTTAPTMKYPEEISITIGEKVNLLKDVTVSDNSEEEITPTIEGEYDTSKAGTYDLKFVAIDSSDNRIEKSFTLIVNEKKTSSNTGSTTNKTTTETNKNTSSKNEADSPSAEEEKKQTPSSNSGSSTPNNTETTTPSTNQKGEDKTKEESSGNNATTNALRSEAESLVNKNWSIYEEHLTYVNAYRAAVGASPLTLDRNMSVAATIRALEMANTDTLSHTRPNGTQCFTIFDEMGVGGTVWGENVAAGDSTAKDAAESWKNSPKHYENMIDTRFTRIGVGMTYLQGTTYGYYWAQIFAN